MFTNPRKFADHINVLGTRFLHLNDSLVAIAVLSKFESSSSKLSRVCRPAAAIVLAAFFQPMLGFTRSDQNPADGGSKK